MIVPRPRLIAWCGAAVAPCVALAAALPDSAAPAVVIAAAVAVVAAADALFAGRRLDGVAVRLPEVIRLTLGRAGAFEIGLSHPGARLRRLRLGLPLPEAIEAPSDRDVELPAGAVASRVVWPCTGRERGNHALAACHIEAASRLGFWDVRRALPVRAEFRVVPDLLRGAGKAAAIFLRRGAYGVRAQRRIGKGREFEKLREYLPGDALEDIHWKATAKRGHPVTKVFQIERTQEVYVAVDVSRLAARPAGEPPAPALEHAITAALVLALAAERQGDLFGLLAFSDRVRLFRRAARGARHFDGIRDALCGARADGATPDFEEVASFIRTRVRRRALIVFLADLEDPVVAEQFARGVELIRRQHLILVNMLRPPGARPLAAPRTAQDAAAGADPGPAIAGDPWAALAGHLAWRGLRATSRALRSRGVDLALVDQPELCAATVSRYLDVKRRQAL